ncbi:hypothetical protein ACJMK2_022510 [Sinanodonta woodiana]|uniref:Uncharacterized protein n=1 Tax=Sinanodonta woodiana TaxID=1069815 RepID=A0ABD3TJ99_SINWO
MDIYKVYIQFVGITGIYRYCNFSLSYVKWHSSDAAYQLIVKEDSVHTDAPAGDKSNCFLLVENSMNINRIKAGKKCNTVKSTFVIENGYLRNVEVKNNKCCIKRRIKGQVTWEELNLQPDEENVTLF